MTASAETDEFAEFVDVPVLQPTTGARGRRVRGGVAPVDDAEVLADLQEAIDRLQRGQPKAAIRCAADAVNRMARNHGVHGYASY